MNNKQFTWDFLMAKIHNPIGVAGLMGNLYAESGINPINLQNTGNTKLKLTDEEYTANVDHGKISKTGFCRDGYGYGIAQWTYRSRKEKLYDFCKNSGRGSIGNLESQLEFLYDELLHSYPSVLKTLTTTNDIRVASDWVLTKYERPANQSQSVRNKRAKYALDIYDEFNKQRYVRINRHTVNVRKGPSTKYKTVGVVRYGQIFPFIDQDKETGWYAIKYEGEVYWITNKYTSIVED